jgi:S-adenosylmethionine decarboxylase
MEKFIDAHFCSKNGELYAGTHLILDVWDGKHLDNISVVETCFRETIKAVHATLLHMHFHHFGPQQGISGVAVLQESHISCHTFPEVNFGSFDVFLCGNLDPMPAVEVFKQFFETEKVEIVEFKRGYITSNDDFNDGLGI